MARMGRPGMSNEMKADLWRRWRPREAISVISRGIGKPPGSGSPYSSTTEEITPLPCKARVGSLPLAEREEISRGLCAGDSYRSIADLQGRAVSTVSREVRLPAGMPPARTVLSTFEIGRAHV